MQKYIFACIMVVGFISASLTHAADVVIPPPADSVISPPPPQSPLFELKPIPDQSARSRDLFRYQVSYAVLDTACFWNIIWSLEQGPLDMRMSSEGTISWIPLAGEEGQTFPVTIRARGLRYPIAACWGDPLDETRSFSISVRSGDDVYVGSFSLLAYNTYLLNPEGPVGEAPENACRGLNIGRALIDPNITLNPYDIVALEETFDDRGRFNLWDLLKLTNPFYVMNMPSSKDSECGRTLCTETGGLSLMSRTPFLWEPRPSHTAHFKGDMCGAIDCRAGKGFIRVEVKNLGGMHATNLQVYLTHTQSNYHTGYDCGGGLVGFHSCGLWYHIRERQLQQIAKHSREYIRNGDGPILYVGDFNIAARDFQRENVHQFFQVYDPGQGTEYEYDRMLETLDTTLSASRGIRDAYREIHPPRSDSLDPNEMLPFFTSNPTRNHLAKGPFHGRIDYQFIDDSRGCYRLEPVSAEHIDLKGNCNTGGESLSDHFAVGVTYRVYRKMDHACRLVTEPLALEPPIPTVFPIPYGPGMILRWPDPQNPGVQYYEVQYSEDGGASWQVYTNTRLASYGPWINHYGSLNCGDRYQQSLKSAQRYDYRVRALDHVGAPLTEWSSVVGATSIDWSPPRVTINGPEVIATKGTYTYTALPGGFHSSPTFTWSERFCEGTSCMTWVTFTGLGETFRRTLGPDCTGTGENTFQLHVVAARDFCGREATDARATALCSVSRRSDKQLLQ